MNAHTYLDIKEKLISLGYADEIAWCENLKPCESYTTFFLEYVHVVVNSGMKAQVAQKIFGRIINAMKDGKSPHSVFKHKGKSDAIQEAWTKQADWFLKYCDRKTAKGKLRYLESLPWIGPITKYHLARNLGLDCCKPDRHLERIARENGTTPHELCKAISELTGDRIGTVDVVIWRAANLGMI